MTPSTRGRSRSGRQSMPNLAACRVFQATLSPRNWRLRRLSRRKGSAHEWPRSGVVGTGVQASSWVDPDLVIHAARPLKMPKRSKITFVETTAAAPCAESPRRRGRFSPRCPRQRQDADSVPDRSRLAPSSAPPWPCRAAAASALICSPRFIRLVDIGGEAIVYGVRNDWRRLCDCDCPRPDS